MPTHARPPRPRSGPDTDALFAELTRLPDGPRRNALRHRIVCAWLPMAERLAARFRSRGEALEDLRQVAALGLVKAVDRYDPERGAAFESYAVPTVVGEIKRHFRDHLWSLHVPRRVQTLRHQVRCARQELERTAPGHSPTVTELADRTGLAEEDVLLGLEAADNCAALSLDAPPAGTAGGFALRDTLGAADPAIDVLIDRESVKAGLSELTERERAVLYLRYFRDMTQSGIARQLGISQMHVSRLLRTTCERLRHRALSEAGT